MMNDQGSHAKQSFVLDASTLLLLYVSMGHASHDKALIYLEMIPEHMSYMTYNYRWHYDCIINDYHICEIIDNIHFKMIIKPSLNLPT